MKNSQEQVAKNRETQKISVLYTATQPFSLPNNMFTKMIIMISN